MIKGSSSYLVSLNYLIILIIHPEQEEIQDN
jgi:hypothetical protein